MTREVRRARGHYQLYESEEGPVSPEFDSAEGLKQWLIWDGYAPHKAQAFVEKGSAPSIFARPLPLGSLGEDSTN